jgi:hypothetical protein
LSGTGTRSAPIAAAPMTAAVIMLIVLIVAFGMEIGWLIAEPPA